MSGDVNNLSTGKLVPTGNSIVTEQITGRTSALCETLCSHSITTGLSKLLKTSFRLAPLVSRSMGGTLMGQNKNIWRKTVTTLLPTTSSHSTFLHSVCVECSY